MMKTTRRGPEWTLGIDLGDRKGHYCWLDESGEVVEEGEVAMTGDRLTALVGARPAPVAVAPVPLWRASGDGRGRSRPRALSPVPHQPPPVLERADAQEGVRFQLPSAAW